MSERVDSHGRSDLPATIAPLWGTAGPTTLPPAPSPTPSFGADAGFGEAVTELQQRVATRLSADGTRYVGLDGVGIVEEALGHEVQAATRDPQLAVPRDPGREDGIEQVHSPVNCREQVRGRAEAHQVARPWIVEELADRDVESRLALGGRLVPGQPAETDPVERQ